MERINGPYLKKCVGHMFKDMEYYMELDGITAPSEHIDKAGPSKEMDTIIKKSGTLLSNVEHSNQIPSTSTELLMKLKSKWPKLSAKQTEHVIENKTLKCTKCDFQTTKKNCLDQHMEGHYDCDQCGQSFIGKNAPRSFARHMKTHVTKSSQVTTWSNCSKDYKEAWRLRSHQNTCKKNE